MRVTRALKLNDCDDDDSVNVDDDDHPNFESVPASLPRTVPKKDNSTLDEGTAHIQETNFIS